jgi:phosphatidylglycerophosphatase A
MSTSAPPEPTRAAAPRPGVAQLARDPALAIAFGFGLGLAPKAPGTFGTLLGIPLHHATVGLDLPLRGAIIALAFGLGVWVCGRAARTLGVHDHPGIVWDEVVGFMIAMLAAPAGWLGTVTGFALFRLFDVWKPWPIRAVDRGVHGGLGIMLDDLLAGAMAAAILWSAQATGLLQG